MGGEEQINSTYNYVYNPILGNSGHYHEYGNYWVSSYWYLIQLSDIRYNLGVL
jgi:hypothetical protein